jgi:AcrR family transcriptional regulator
MTSKSEKTRQFVLEKAAPIFNKNGYVGTSLSDITKVTGLSKGSIYGNFKNKEELALASFNYNIKSILGKINVIMLTIESPLSKLYAITDFYRNYYKNQINFGGCPILNVGVDAHNTNPELFKRVKNIALKIQKSITVVIEEGQKSKELKQEINADLYGSRIFSLIEGAVFTSVLLKDDKYLMDMMNHLDKMIKTELQS